jgi:hypothetical protein
VQRSVSIFVFLIHVDPVLDERKGGLLPPLKGDPVRWSITVFLEDRRIRPEPEQLIDNLGLARQARSH